MHRFVTGRRGFLLIAAALGFAALAGAQESDSETEPEPELTPLKVELVFTKYDEGKLVSRLPYNFIVNAGETKRMTRFRMGFEVPITGGHAEKKVQYRNVGTNIDCDALVLSDGRFKVNLSVEHSSLFPGEPAPTDGREIDGNLFFRTLSSNFSPILRDGQTMELTSGTDPMNGVVTKVEVSLSVLK